ncbi:hypothetical protein NIES593_10575 [Hydrococcus rivularis NIES-593]|uniref:Uncharacterized protein n=1 Tax=Hydrococcus rivularis NIES-593 TaxID=1921803 RepID=A0A1U7HI57_9CYAN|nr:hypothetical protein NIES593_10575 [Hydrococcus rivularis NIES-593]
MSVAISPDGKTLVSSSADKTVKIWQLSTGKELYELRGYSAEISSVTISPNGTIARLNYGIWQREEKLLL